MRHSRIVAPIGASSRRVMWWHILSCESVSDGQTGAIASLCGWAACDAAGRLVLRQTCTPAVYRDRGEVLEPNKPAVVLLDGVERTESIVKGTNVVVMPAAVVGLIPQIFVLLLKRDDAANTLLNGVLAPIGPEISGWRSRIIALLAQDETLAAMLGPNGRIEYRGSDTDMQTGSTIGVEGAVLQMNFALFWVCSTLHSYHRRTQSWSGGFTLTLTFLNLVIPKGFLIFTEDGTDTPIHLGNATKITYKPNVPVADHYTEMAGTKLLDFSTIIQKGGTIDMSLEERTAQNIAIFFLGVPTYGSGPFGSVASVGIFSRVNQIQGVMQVVASNDVGPRWMLDLTRVLIAPSGDYENDRR